MATSSKPRRKYRPRPVVRDPIKLAMRRASVIPPAEIAAVMEPIKASFRAMREGVGSESNWMILFGAIHLAQSIERQGIVRGIAGHLTAAEVAIGAVKRRAMERGTWRPTALYWQEIEALDAFVDIHRHQLEHLSEGEWHEAADRVEAVVRSAGEHLVDVRELQDDDAQLQLLGGRP